MKKWIAPKLSELNIKNTYAGGLGNKADGVVYEIFGFKLVGTSGPAIDDPDFIVVS